MENTEGSEGTPTKISDSGYSNSCGNSQSQRSGSTKSRHSGSNSSGSSGYGGKTSSSLTNSNEAIPQPLSKHKDNKKKKTKGCPPSGPVVETSGDRTPLRNPSNQQECMAQENDNINASTSAVQVPPSQQHTEENEKMCLTPVSAHSILENNTIRDDDNIQIPASLPSAKTGDTTSIPGSLGGRNTDDEIACFSPSKATIDSFFQTKINNTIALRNQFTTTITGFSCVVSMRDGVILYTNSSINTSLGYPKDMWLGKSFIDFIHPKDRNTFATHITSGIALPLTEADVNKADGKTSLFCRIRRYHGLRSLSGGAGYGVREREICFTPFQLDFSFREVTNIENSGMYLVITAHPVISPYADTKSLANRFVIRHNSNGIVSQVNPDAVACLGYLPQDIIGRSIFDYYHPEDMAHLKEIYEIITKRENPFKSKPFRLLAQNGDYLSVETEWSTFVNPWSRKLEFVIGYHHVVQPPINVDVFQSMKCEMTKNMQEDSGKQFRKTQEEILMTMNEILTKFSESEKQQVSKRCKELATFMEGLTDGMTRLDDELRIEIPKEKSLSERDSVMLGEISPHHDYYDSKSSTETPPSYNQLNFSENLQRFFESHPWTSHRSSTPDLKSSSYADNDQSSSDIFMQECPRKCYSPRLHESGESGASGSSGESYSKLCESRLLSHSRHMNYTPPKHSVMPMYNTADYKPTHLTQDILNKHNIMMEKQLAKKHKEARSVSKAEEREKGEQRREKKMDFYAKNSNSYTLNQIASLIDMQPQDSHGVKRHGSPSWEQDVDTQKPIKLFHPNQSPPQNYIRRPQGPANILRTATPAATLRTPVIPNMHTETTLPGQTGTSGLPDQYATSSRPEVNQMGAAAPVNMWPPFSVAVTQVLRPIPSCSESMNHNTNEAFTNVFPAVYLIPTQQQPVPPENPGPAKPTGYTYPYTMYPHPIVSTPPFLHSHMAMAYPSMALPPNHLTIPTVSPPQPQVKPLGLPFNNYRQACQRSVSKPPSSRMSALIRESIGVSGPPQPITNLARIPADKPQFKADSDSGARPQSVADPNGSKIGTSSGVKRPDNVVRSRSSEDLDGEESSYSSFYSSFLKTETSTSIENADSSDEILNVNDKGNRSNMRDIVNQRDMGKNQSWCRRVENRSLNMYDKRNSTRDDECQQQINKPVRKMQPPWLDSVCVTSELIYRYQIDSKDINEILKNDETRLESIDQPSLVNEQLSQLYVELQLEGLSSKLKLDEGMTSSSSEDEPTKSKRKKREYNKLVMIYEEDAPLPSPTS